MGGGILLPPHVSTPTGAADGSESLDSHPAYSPKVEDTVLVPVSKRAISRVLRPRCQISF